MRRLVALVIVGRSVIGHSCPCRLLGPQAIYMKSAPLGVDACCASMLAAVVCSVHEMVVYMGKSLPLLSMSSSVVHVEEYIPLPLQALHVHVACSIRAVAVGPECIKCLRHVVNAVQKNEKAS